MREYWRRFVYSLAVNKWPVLTPAQLQLAEQKKKLDKLYNFK